MPKEVTPDEFNKIPWGDMHKAQQRVIVNFEQEIEKLKKKVAEQDELLKSEAWMCKACKASFPKMLVRTTPQGRMQCPRCLGHGAGDIVRAGEAIRAVMQAQIGERDLKIKALEKEIEILKDGLRKTKLRPGQARTVEDA